MTLVESTASEPFTHEQFFYEDGSDLKQHS